MTMRWIFLIGAMSWFLAQSWVIQAQVLSLPDRPSNSLSGSEFAKSIRDLERPEREEKVFAAITGGNVPAFLRQLAPIQVELKTNGQNHLATYFVTPDYLAVGNDDDYFLTPLSPIMAQRIATFAHCLLPTTRIVDDIYAAAKLKLEPLPIPPSSLMATVPVFIQHNETVWLQRSAQLTNFPLGTLVAGHKKDVVISNKLPPLGNKVAIYGWQKLDGKPIQPLYCGHADFYADYSHGIRLVQSAATVDGQATTIQQALTNAELAPLFSKEGIITNAAYPTNFFTRETKFEKKPTAAELLAGFSPSEFDEQTLSTNLDPEVKILINAPQVLNPSRQLKLVFYALPNGNTIAQTAGKKSSPGDDWHYNIQHIGAQTRFLRQRFTNCSLVVVYLESTQKSWPAWRQTHTNDAHLIPQIIESVRNKFTGYDVKITLSGHSGGGSFIFGYLNAVTNIPSEVERIAFLDSNYAYNADQGHAVKLTQWLDAATNHYLCVLAYNDAVALLSGKSFVSASGGTWGRSHAMMADLQKTFPFYCQTNGTLETYQALNGRVEFLLKENPEHQILHTVQVERNGFIECLLAGTPLAGIGYAYFGDRAYGDFIGSGQ